MEITPEMVIAVLGSVSLVLGALAYIGKRRADARLVQAEAGKEKAEAEAETAKAEAQETRDNSAIRLKEAENKVLQDAATRTMNERNSQLINQLQQERMDWLKELQAKEVRDEKNYHLLADTQRDNTQMLLTEIQNSHSKLVVKFDELPEKMHGSGVAMLGDFAKTMAGEIASQMAQEFMRLKMESSMYPFPDPDDPGWVEETVYPTTPEVTIRKEPRFSDDSMLKKPCAKIKGGERVRLITGRMPQWVIVDKSQDGIRCWGWVPDYSLKIGEALVSN